MVSRKEDFVQLVKEGKTNSEIAKALGITEQSASTYYKRYGITRNYVAKMGEHVAQIELRELQKEIPKDRRIDGTPLFTPKPFENFGEDLLEVKKGFEITVKRELNQLERVVKERKVCF